jgi:Secretion system C-terminal sorting domain
MFISLEKRIVSVFSSVLCLSMAFAPKVLLAQIVPHISLIQVFGGLRPDEGYGIVQTGDSGFIVAGYTGDTVEPGLPDYHGGFEDAWVLKLDNSGNIVWEKCLGDTLEEEANSIVQTKDGGYCVAIRTESSGGEVVPPDSNWVVGASDGWIVKLTPDHQIQWATVIGGSNWDDVLSIIQSDDGGYAVAGYTASGDGCVTGHFGGDTISDDDAWITKLDSAGHIEWSKCYGNMGEDWAQSIVQTPDHGFCFAGFTSLNGGEVTGYHGGTEDAWVAKIDSVGNFEWGKCFGGDSIDWATSVALTADSGFIVAGGTYSNDGDVSGNHGDADAWVIKLNSTGDMQWQKCLGGSQIDKGWSAVQTSDGGYIVGCMAMSNDGDVTGNHGTKGDAWIVKLDPNGMIEWQKCVGGSGLDAAYNIIQLLNGDFAFTGETESADGDIPFYHGNEDMLVAVLSNSSSVVRGTAQTTGSISLYPLPATNSITIDYSIPMAASNLRIEVRNILGMIVSTSIENPGEAGTHESNLDLSSFVPGCYFVTLSAPGFYEAAPFQVIAR